MIVRQAKRLWHWHRSPESLWSRRITLTATLLFTIVATRGRPWELFARGGFSTDFYDAQAHAFLHGRIDVAASIAGAEGFLIDGKTYLYYGPLLALGRLPFAVFGHWADGRVSLASMVLAFFVACSAAFHLSRRISALLRGGSLRRHAVLVAAVACSPALSLAGWNSVYDETEMWAFALFLLTAVAALRMWDTPSRRSVVSTVALGCCTVLTRSSVGLGALAAIGLLGVLMWRRHRRASVAACVGAAAGVLLNVGINFAKFTTWFDLPADRQVLSLQDPTRAAWFAGNDGSYFSPRFLPTTIVHYLRPDALDFERLVPFVRFGPAAREFGSYPLQGNTPASSLPASATLLFILAILGIWVLVRRRSWPLLAVWLGALAAAAPSFLIGFVAHRYLTDMLPALVIPAAAAVAVVAVPAVGGISVARWGVAALTVWGAWVNVSLALWIQNLKEPGFTEVRYRIDDIIFGGAPPSVIDLQRDGAVPRDGIVAIDGNCDGLYIAEQTRWVALELSDVVRRVRGTLRASEGPVTLTTVDGIFDITFDNEQSAATVSYLPAAGERVTGQSVPLSGETAALTIESDPVTGNLSVRLDGRLALFSFAGPTLVDAVATPNFVASEPNDTTPVCNDLQARR